MTVSLLAVLGTGVVPPGTPVIEADDPGLTRGDGCFEGCRVQTDSDGRSRVDKPESHLTRMAGSAGALGIPFDPARWRALLDEALSAWREPGEWTMKLLLTRSGAGLLTISPLPPAYPAQRRDGVSVITLDRGTAADAYQAAPWLLGGVKTLSYVVNMAAQREAARRGADDVVFLSTDGFALEAPTSSLVWAADGTLFTTPLAGTGILGGTTQQLLFERAAASGWQVSSRLARVAELMAADSLWLVGTVRGPVDIVSVDGTARSRDEARTAEIRKLCGFAE